MANGYNILWEHVRPVLEAEKHRICDLLDFPITASVVTWREGHGYLSLLKDAWSQEVAIHFDAGWISGRHSIVIYVYGGPDFDVEGPDIDWPLEAEPGYYGDLAAQVAGEMAKFIAEHRSGIVQRITAL